MIIIRGLNKAFGEKIIFSNFNLEIPDGSFVVISGDSGSGKSTLLNMIGGIEKPDSGSIIIEGLNITRLKNKNSFFADTVGFLFQNFALPLSPLITTKLPSGISKLKLEKIIFSPNALFKPRIIIINIHLSRTLRYLFFQPT